MRYNIWQVYELEIKGAKSADRVIVVPNFLFCNYLRGDSLRQSSKVGSSREESATTSADLNLH